MRRLVGCLLLLGCCAAARADDWADARRQYSQGNFQESYEIYVKIAGAGSGPVETAQAWIYAAWAKYTLGDREGMRDSLRKALAAHPDVAVDADLFNETFAREFQGIRNELVPALLPEQMSGVQASIQTLSDLYLQGKYKECLQTAEKALTAGQRFRQIYKLQGDCWVGENAITEASGAYASASRSPSFLQVSQQEMTPEAKLRKSRSLYHRGEKKQTQALLSQLVYGVNPPAEVFSLLGTILLEQKLYTEAEKVLQQGLILHAGDAPYYNLYGVALFAQDKYAEAAKFFQQAAALNPMFVAALANLAAAYVQLREFSAAETYYQQAVQLDPTSAVLLGDYGRVMLFDGKYGDAAARISDALRFATDPAPLLYLRGLANLYGGKQEEADADLAAYLKASPGDAAAAEAYGILLRRRDKCDAALPHLEKAASLPGRRALAQCTLRLGHASEAAAILEALPQDDVGVLNDLAAVYASVGEYGKARAAAAKIPADRRVTFFLDTCKTVEAIADARAAFGLP